MITFPSIFEDHPYFSELIESCKGKTEVGHSFIVGGGIVAAASILGRRIGLESFPKPLYPNMFLVLCGESGGSRKSASLAFISELLERSDPCVHHITSIATAEGLIRQFALPQGRIHGSDAFEYPNYTDDDDTEKQEKKRATFRSSCLSAEYGIDRYIEDTELINEMLNNASDSEGFRAVAFIDELAALLKKAKQATSEGVIPRIAEFYAASKVSNQTSGSPVTAVNPCLNLVGAIPAEWLDGNIDSADILGGIGRRFQWIHDSGAPENIPFPKHYDESHFSRAVAILGNLRKKFEYKTIFEWHSTTEELMREWYDDFKTSLKTSEERDIIKPIREGQDTHIRKTALVFAALDPGVDQKNAVIMPEHLELAMEWTNYILRCQIATFENFSETKEGLYDKKMLNWLRGKGWKTAREIYQCCHIPSRHAKERLEHLTAMDVLLIQEATGGNGRTFYQYKLNEAPKE